VSAAWHGWDSIAKCNLVHLFFQTLLYVFADAVFVCE
jgi:hypothetical protein